MPIRLRDIENPHSVITPIDSKTRFPESIEESMKKYRASIGFFNAMIQSSSSSAQLLAKIRAQTPAPRRMSLLKLFRRCVAPIIDTEMAKKVRTVSTETLVDSYGASFKPISKLKQQFANLSESEITALVVLLGEYDGRGLEGYQLTETFFDWFEEKFPNEFSISGPRGAGPDIELVTVFPDFKGSYPCDFIIKDRTETVVAIGFARYDSTRGGSQSDDRTGGNANKIDKAQRYCEDSGKSFRLIFVADGPGLAHRDTWAEAVYIDGAWGDNVRVTTLKLAESLITPEWLSNS